MPQSQTVKPSQKASENSKTEATISVKYKDMQITDSRLSEVISSN
jgi:hypothetical protein